MSKYPKIRIVREKYNDPNEVVIDEARLVKVDGTKKWLSDTGFSGLIQPANWSGEEELKCKCFYLGREYDWVIALNANDELRLIPLKKKDC